MINVMFTYLRIQSIHEAMESKRKMDSNHLVKREGISIRYGKLPLYIKSKKKTIHSDHYVS